MDERQALEKLKILKQQRKVSRPTVPLTQQRLRDIEKRLDKIEELLNTIDSKGKTN